MPVTLAGSMTRRVGRRVLAMAIAVGGVGIACARGGDTRPPSIEFTTIPEAAVGGSERLAPVAGRVIGARAGQHVVLYAKSGVWWVQPVVERTVTTIEADSTWKSSIHLGSEYAALLVNDDFRPPATVVELPSAGGAVVAVAVVPGVGNRKTERPKTLVFSGYEWEVRGIPSDRGGQNNYNPDNAWTDADGFLHLRLARQGTEWTSAEVILSRSLGYGTYQFTVRDTSVLDPAATFGMITWDEQSVGQNNRELDIEISQWGDPNIPNAQYVVQPYYVPANVARFTAPRGPLTHMFRWEPGRAAFRTMRGRNAAGTDRVAGHEFASGVPTPGTERVRMNLYYFRYSPHPPQKDIEVVVERFQYLP
jgi:hypothetical protein